MENKPADRNGLHLGNDEAQKLAEEYSQKRSFPLSWIAGYFKPYVPAIFLSFFLALVVNGASLAGPYITELAIDRHLIPGSGDKGALAALAIAYLMCSVVGAGVGYFQELLVARIGQSIIMKMRTELFDKIQRLTMSFFDKNSSGRIFTRLTSDVDSMSEMVSVVMVSFFTDGILIIGIIGAMIALSPRVSLYALPVLPIIVISVLLYKIFIKKTFIKVKAALSHMNGFLAETITGFGTIKLFGREKEKNEEFGVLTKRYYRLGLREIILHTFSNPYMDMLNNLATAFLFWIFARDIVGGVVEIGILYAEITYLKRFFDPVIAIIDQYTNIQSAFVSGERIYSILNIPEEEDYETGERLQENTKGKIEFRNVWFAYSGDNYVLKDVSFTAEPGSRIAFVGATGAGKSTIISLIGRLYNIQKGDILLDGVSIYNINLHDLRSRIAVIQQEPYLFSGTLRDNITLGDDSYTDDMISRACEVTGADGFIGDLEGGYDSMVSERGRTYSAGQRQLVSFTRAAVRTPSVFILDEATANIDTETENHIRYALEGASRGITRITIAHRLSTIRDSDCIYVLQKGELRESGTHDELIALGGIYKKLCDYSA